MKLACQLASLEVPSKNEVKRYLPIRNKGNKFMWKSIAGDVLAHAMGHQIKAFNFQEFESRCKVYFDQTCGPNLWPTLERTYFSNRESLLRLDPRFSFLSVASPRQSGAKANARMASIFKDLLGSKRLTDMAPPSLNFIELKILDQVNELLRAQANEERRLSYLPFLEATFQGDLRFLSHHPRYLLEQFEEFLKLYAMSYSAQLALNVKNFREEPRSRNLYFILASEKAGSERVHVTEDGMRLLRSSLASVFPVLSMAEAVQANSDNKELLPLWMFYQRLRQLPSREAVVEALNRYSALFAEKRKVAPPAPADSLESALENLIKIALDQFDDSTREGVNKKYVGQFEEHVFQDFTQSRGRAGKVLVLTQDQLLLITNLVVGDESKLWFKDVLAGFEARGIFLDKRSEMALVEFYERIGNVERRSDSGAAIYITKTL